VKKNLILKQARNYQLGLLPLGIILILFFSIFVLPKPARADFSKEKSDLFGAQTVANSAGLFSELPNLSKKTGTDVVAQAFGIAMSFLAVIFFLLIIYAGVTWMMAWGSSEDVEKAKDILQAAVIGLLIVLAAYALTTFVFKNVIGSARVLVPRIAVALITIPVLPNGGQCKSACVGSEVDATGKLGGANKEKLTCGKASEKCCL
jgi:hypothetical protein